MKKEYVLDKERQKEILADIKGTKKYIKKFNKERKAYFKTFKEKLGSRTRFHATARHTAGLSPAAKLVGYRSHTSSIVVDSATVIIALICVICGSIPADVLRTSGIHTGTGSLRTPMRKDGHEMRPLRRPSARASRLSRTLVVRRTSEARTEGMHRRPNLAFLAYGCTLGPWETMS